MSWEACYRRWAAAWLDGSNRSAESTRREVDSAYWAAYSAAYSAAISAARSTAISAAHSVELSARYAPIDLPALAREAIT